MWSTGHSAAFRMSATHCSSVCPSAPKMRSIEKCGKPASATRSIASSVALGEYLRPSVRSVFSSKLCTPIEILLAPASLRAANFRGVAFAGAISTVHSSVGKSPFFSKARRSFSMCVSERIDGVPPPQNIVCGVGIFPFGDCLSSISASTASTYASSVSRVGALL